MTAWIIEPREPLIVRDGRPFDPQPGVMAATLPFPFPSTTAGAARGRAGSKDGVFTAEEDVATLKRIQVRGPLLAQLDENAQWKLLAPAPADALLLEGDGPLRCKQLVPLQLCSGDFISSPQGADGQELAPVGLEKYEGEKPAKNLPAFWHWQKFAQWLLEPKQINDKLSRDTLGIQPLPQQQRVHVALEPGMMVAREGALFETRSLEFTTQPLKPEKSQLAQARRLALWLDVEEHEHEKYHIQEGLDSLGGERRLVKWQKSESDLEDFDALRAQVSERIARDHACRLILLTPAYFQNGYLPNLHGWEWENTGVKPQLSAALVQRPQVVSGWDLENGNRRPTRRLAPAGSVYFLKFPKELEKQAIESWIKHIWMNCVSDEEQARLDGFGLALLGTWDREFKEMQIKEGE